MMKSPVAFSSLISALLLLATRTLLAAEPVLVTGPGGILVTQEEVTIDVAQRVPAESRAEVLSQPGDVTQLAIGIAMRRALAAEAEMANLDKDPQVALQIKLAREQVLADARLAKIDGERPERAALEKAALGQYRAEPEKYVTPEEIRVRHILIDPRSCDADKRIAEVLQQARAPGSDFAALAREFSQDPGSAKRGGDLGFVARGRMTPEFDRAAFALKAPGEISDVVKTRFGLHIIQLEERRPAQRQPFDKVRDAIVDDLIARDIRSRRALATEATLKSLQVNNEAIEAFTRRSR